MKLPRQKLYITFKDLFNFFNDLLLSKSLSRGKIVFEFEKKITNYYNVKRCFALSSARIGLYYLLKSLDLSKDDEVLLTPLQIPDYLNIINEFKLKPIFIEMDKNSHSIDINDLKKKINNKSKVLLLTFLAGMLPEINRIREICNNNNIFIIEDISQSYGCNLSPSYQDSAAIGSLSPAKIISSIGGGFCITNNDKLINRIDSEIKKENIPSKKILFEIWFYQLKVKLLTSKHIFSFFTYYIFLILSKFSNQTFEEIHNPNLKKLAKSDFFYSNPVIFRKLPKIFFSSFVDAQAKIAINTFNRNITYGLKKRKENAEIFYKNLKKEVLKKLPKNLSQIRINAYWHFPIILDNTFEAQKLKKYMLENGIDLVGYGLKLCNTQFEKKYEKLYSSNQIHGNTLFLPMHDDFSEKEIKKTCNILNNFSFS